MLPLPVGAKTDSEHARESNGAMRLSASRVARSYDQAPAEDVLPLPGSGEEVPIRIQPDFGSILLDAEINGKPVTLLIDTGASHTTLSVDVLPVSRRSLGTVKSPLRKVPGLIGRVAWATARTVRIGSTVWNNQHVLVSDGFSSVSTVMREDVHGLLGQDLLMHFRIVAVDFKRRKLVLVP
jgi:hypothetical protein